MISNRGWAALALAAVGCGSTEDDPRAALPRTEDLSLAVPATAAEKPLVGETAALYVVTRQTTEHLNGMIASALGSIWSIAEQTPTAVDGPRVVWGPFTPTLSPLTYRLVLERGAEVVVFRLDAWPRGGGDTVVLVTGEAAADGHSGTLRATTDEGSLTVGYNHQPDGLTLALVLDEAHYGYAQRAGGAGSFVFATDDGIVHASWLASGAGRAEVGTDGAGAIECWDALFRRVFFAGPGGAEGDAAACPDAG